MSLPSAIKDSIKAVPYNPGIVSNDPELAYTLSLSDFPITNNSIHFHPKDTYQSPLSQYPFADFDDSTYDHLLQQTINNYRTKNASVIKGIRSSFKEFYARMSTLTYQSLMKYNPINAPRVDKKFQISKEELDFRTEGIKGNIPAKWPEGLNEFHREINKLPWNAFSTQSFLLLEDIVSQIKNSIVNCTKKLKVINENQRSQLIQRLIQQCEVLISIALKTLSQTFLLQQILFIEKLLSETEINFQEQRIICEKLTEVLKIYLKSIPKNHEQKSKYHCNQDVWNLNSFLLMKKVNFQKSAGLSFYSVTTDGKYLYVYISSMNGGMFKFGTGNNGTVAGQLYFERIINLPVGAKADDVCWVYLKGKIYLKSATKDPSHLDVYSPEDFKKIGTVQLACKSLFGHTILITLNRNSVLMTDGQHLYFLGKRIKIVQNSQSLKPKAEQKKQEAQQNDKTSKKQKKKKKNQNQQNPQQQPPNQETTDQSLKFVEFVLAKFDVQGRIDEEQSQPVDEQAIQDIFESFSGYFTRQQCKRAYRLNHYDVMQACQWLFDEGNKQKEKAIKILPVQRTVVLCESEINNNFNQKTFKNVAQVVTKQGSLLHMQNVTESIWTMDSDEITCYSQNGMKIFSKKPILQQEDKSKNIQKINNSTLLSRKDIKHSRNPKYTMIYDPYNKLFYTFCWHTESYYFPCPVFVSKDYKEEIQFQLRKRSSVDTSSPQKISQIARFYLSELSLLQIRDEKNFCFNDHVWWYGQKIKKLNVENTTANADERKRISNKKAKIMTKLNKLNEITKSYQHNMDEFTKKGKVTKQIIKLYPFDSDGSIENLNQILQSFKNIENCPKNSLIASFLVVIQKWLQNSSSLHTKQLDQKIKSVLSILLKIHGGPSTSVINKEQVIKTILRHLNIFCKTREEAVQFLVSLQPHNIKNFLEIFNSNEKHASRESLIYELNKKDLIVQKYDSKHNFGDIFKESCENKVQPKNMVALVLMRKQKQISTIHTSVLQFVESMINSVDSLLFIEFFMTLFAQAFKEIHSLKNTQERINYRCNLFQDSLRIIQKCLSVGSVQKTIEFVPIVSFIVQVYYASAIRLLANQNIIKSLLKIIDLIQKPELIEFYSYVKNLEFEGVSTIQQRIYQTTHPLERGKSQVFPSAHFPESSLLFLDFDKRCQSDQNHDIMTIQLLQDQNPIGNCIPCFDEVFSTYLRLTGKIDLKKPVLMLGNSISIDFNSSGHAKDAQSFGRFGFKFGLRPINAGKIVYEKNVDMKKLQKTFKSQKNFKTYINTLKFLVVAVSTTLQSLYTLQEDECSQTIKQLLKGKIVRQGLQQAKKSQSSINYQQVINNFLEKNYQDPQKEILKLNNLGLLFKEEKKINAAEPKAQQNLWGVEGVPQYIKSYIEEIKNFKGGFIEVFKEARVHAPPQGSYSHELRRPGFTPELRQLWLQGQALLFLTVLKHSGLLHLNLKFSIEYIKQNLKAFEQARNGIFYAFISRMQTVRQWRDLVQTYHGKHEQLQQEPKKQEEKKQQKKSQPQGKKQILIRKNNRVIRTVQFQNKQSAKPSTTLSKRGHAQQKEVKKSKQQLEQQRIKQVEKQIRERLNNEFLIQQICTLKKLQFVQNNIHDNVTRILEQIKKVDVENVQFKQSVYIEPINHLIKGCLFLLTCKSPSTRESLQKDNDIVPVGLGRSLSSDNKHADTNKVQLFREWLQNWKKWKGFKKENRIELKFPVLEIVQFINSWTDINSIKQAIQRRTKMCQHRIDYYKHLTLLLKQTSQSILISKYAFGSQINIGENYKQQLESAPMGKLQQLTLAYNDYAQCIKQIEGKFMKLGYNDFLKMLGVNANINVNSANILNGNIQGNNKKSIVSKEQSISYNHKPFLDRLRINAELIFMIESQNPNMSLDMALYFINFKFLSNQCEQILFLSSLIVRRALIVEHKLPDVLQKIKKQVGSNNLTAKRWKDLLFIQRVLFLLRKLQQIIRKKSLQIDEKQRVAQTLFYLLNLTEVPAIHKVGLKVLKKLKDVNFTNINTLFNNRFNLIKLDTENNSNKAIIGECFSIQNSTGENNVQLLSKKSLSVFKNNFVSNQVQKRLLSLNNNENNNKSILPPTSTQQEKQNIAELPISTTNKQSYSIILNIHQQQDLIWFLRVLFYIEELQRQSGKGNISEVKDWKEYLQMKANKQNKKNQQQQQQQNNQQQAQQQQLNKPINKLSQRDELNSKQRIFSFIPDKILSIDPKLQQELPVGWYMTYINVFEEFSTPKTIPKPKLQSPTKTSKKPQYQQNNAQQQQNQPNKKAWTSTTFLKVTKKFQQFNSKPLQEPKQTDSQEVKAQYIKAKNFIMRIRKHLAQISSLISQFTNSGYVVFREDLSKQKALQLCHLISLGAQNKLKPIKVDFNKDEYKTRILIEDAVYTPSKIKITLIESENYPAFEELLALQASVHITSDSSNSSYMQINKKQYILQDSAYLPFEDFLPLDQSSQHHEAQFCKEFIQSQIFKMKKRQEEVYLPDYPKLKYFISQGGIETGLKNVTLVPASQHSLTLQSVPIQDVLTTPSSTQAVQEQQQATDFPEEIIEKLLQILTTKLHQGQQINSQQKIMDYLLFSFYLKKLSKMDLKFVSKDLLKNLANSLVRFSEGVKSYQPTQHYESEMQKLLIKFIDCKQSNLRIFKIFNSVDYEISPNITAYINKQQQNYKKSEINSTTKQDIGSHHFPKSSYLLKSQAPQIQENKLLKYWEKNILPKIYQFVKTTLRPLQIDDFFEQMRMPLRKNDQMEAKKIAYVICDNKLPQGAVLPDSNHNWNSFSLEDIQIGQYALVKLPKNYSQAISPLLMTGAQEYRLVKIVFIDIKAPSVLVRYRIDQYSIMGYLWVPINSLVRVEKQIMHLSPQLLQTEIQKNIKGMIYGYSKLCLTQLTSVSDLDQTKLIKETIADLFIHDPISGWLSKPQQQWSMRNSLKTMIDKGDMQIVEFLQKEFCPVQSFDTDLFTDQVTQLNRFQNAKALIVSFKRTAGISLTSGVKFYKDPYLFNEIMHIYTTKSEKTEFQPLIFNDPNVFCKYYTNKECLKPAEMNKYMPKAINVTVFGVDEIWTIGCYLGEVISQLAQEQGKVEYLETLRRLNKLYIKWILEKKVAVLCSELSKLVSRITNRIIAIQEKNNIKTTSQSLGVDQATTKDLLTWIKTLLQQEEKTPLALYSEILQNLSQMIAVMLRKLPQFVKSQTLPQHIQAIIDLLNVLLRIDQHLRGVKITQKPQPLGQWQRFLLINKIPDYVERKDLINEIKEIINRNKGKILTPKYDIFPKDDKLLVCVQGWNITELVEEQIVEKIEKEQQEEKEQQQDQGLLMEWQCMVCTFVNPMGNSHCEMCGTEMPLAPAAQEVYQEVEATDVGKAENKLKQLQSKRFETIKQEIVNYLHTYWENTNKKVQKRNKQLEESKNKPVIKRKQQQKVQELPKPLPQKPQISLLTGSDILNDQIIESFLEYRWSGFKQSAKKLVESENSYLSKFKKLQTLGYDLWCDNIFHENPTLIPFERLYQLMNYIQGEICKGSSSVLSYSEKSIRLLSTISILDSDDQPINYQVQNNIGVKTKYKNLAELKSYNIRYSWKIVKELNIAASKCLQFINTNLKYYDQESQGVRPSDCLGWKIKSFRNLIMGAIKLELTQKIIQKTSVLREPQEVPKIHVQRLKVREQRGKEDRPVSLREKEDFLFTKAHEQFSKVSSAMLRPFKPKGTDPYLSFSITFRGQMAMGEAGPYRQFFTDISTQLDPKNHMGLFIPTPNNKHSVGEAKSKWTVNPKANSSYHLSLFQFLGLLMGCCIRTGTHLALDLPKMFWKLLVSEKVTDSDIEQTDFQLLETLKMIKEIPNQQMFEELQEYTEPISWTFKTSDEEEHQIIHNGKNVKVTFEEREKYIAEVKRKRVTEAMLQINRIKKGLQEMMPQSYFNCVTGDELKLMVCGRPKVDVDLLRKHTKYAGGLNEQEKRIKYFWQVMREIDEADKLKVIKFCWGQERLPINSEQFERNNIRFMIKPMMNEKVTDQSLPKADTCFFNIELPNYSTKQVMRQKLLLAINMDCVSINADQNFNPDDNPLMNEIEDDVMYEGEQGENQW